MRTTKSKYDLIDVEKTPDSRDSASRIQHCTPDAAPILSRVPSGGALGSLAVLLGAAFGAAVAAGAGSGGGVAGGVGSAAFGAGAPAFARACES